MRTPLCSIEQKINKKRYQVNRARPVTTRHRQPDASLMTKIATFAAVALIATLVAGFVQVVPVASALEIANSYEIAGVSANQKVRCIMPPA